jgi:hypothetical protein
MTTTIQIKLLAAILAVLIVIAGVLLRDQRKHEEVIRPDPATIKQFRNSAAPPKKRISSRKQRLVCPSKQLPAKAGSF